MANFGFSIHDGDLKYIAPDGTEIDVAEAGSGIMCVNFTLGEGDTITADKTYEEIVTAMEAGVYVYAVAGNDRLHISSYIEDSEIWFSLVFMDNSVLISETIVINSDDTIPISYNEAAYDLSSLILED